ncbi:hypothetical protein AVEN_80918-1 [Araneus ventricosus]|uniref:Uncharacterized protein n=1 Tax=Araneus ventricosus TaxID=182803 RepID=A0A4Y2PRU4_ARAVE|nr:hypothetical protein AVEN_80918-1 [Araneus ventricosus]
MYGHPRLTKHTYTDGTWYSVDILPMGHGIFWIFYRWGMVYCGYFTDGAWYIVDILPMGAFYIVDILPMGQDQIIQQILWDPLATLAPGYLLAQEMLGDGTLGGLPEFLCTIEMKLD